MKRGKDNKNIVYSIYLCTLLLFLCANLCPFWFCHFACQDCTIQLMVPGWATSYRKLIGLSTPMLIMIFQNRINSWVRTSFSHCPVRNLILKKQWFQGTLHQGIWIKDFLISISPFSVVGLCKLVYYSKRGSKLK